MKSITRMTRPLAFAKSPFAWITFVSINVAYIFMTRVERPLIEWRLRLQEQILDGSAPEPFRFRVLLPWLANEGQQILSRVFSPEWSHLLSFFMLNSLFLWVVLWNIWKFNNKLSFQSKIVGILIFGFAANVGLFDHFYQPWTLLEAAIVSTGFRQAVNGRFGWLPFLAIVGTLNRDTGVLLPVMIFLFVLLTGKRNVRTLLLVVSSVALAVGTFIALRVAIGPAPQVTPLEDIFATNLSSLGLLKLVVNLVLMFGAGWLFASCKGQHNIFRYIWISFAPYFAFILVFGIWLEVRLLLPLVWVLAVQIGESFGHLGRADAVEGGPLSGDERI